ncbi:MAG: prepilin-type N-terminal cleavage/methylation domain-containing protein [Lacipirellulaceae bacterium]
MFRLRNNQRQQAKRSGFSLVEMIAATALVAGTLVPALAVMREAMSLSRETHLRSLLANFAVMKLEECSSVAMRNWTNATDDGDLSAYGYSNLSFTMVRSDDPADGGMVGQLMSISVTVFDDLDGDLIPDTGETQVQFRTKISKLLTYENEEV